MTFLAPNMEPIYRAIVQRLAEQLPCPIQFAVGRAYADVEQADLLFICGLPYVLRTAPYKVPSQLEAIAAPVLQGERYQGKPIYFSDVITHGSAQSFADLRDKTWAYNEPESQSGYGITRYEMVKRGETHGYFRQVIEAGFHQKAIRLVSAGEIDAAAIDSQVLAIELRDHPELKEKIRVIEVFGPSTIQPIAVSAKLPHSLKQDIQQILVEMQPADQLAQGLIERFVAVQDGDYDDIRRMLAACEAANFMVLK